MKLVANVPFFHLDYLSFIIGRYFTIFPPRVFSGPATIMTKMGTPLNSPPMTTHQKHNHRCVVTAAQQTWPPYNNSTPKCSYILMAWKRAMRRKKPHFSAMRRAYTDRCLFSLKIILFGEFVGRSLVTSIFFTSCFLDYLRLYIISIVAARMIFHIHIRPEARSRFFLQNKKKRLKRTGTSLEGE